MSFATEASKLLTNKYFLYFMIFLAATNVLGYLVTNKLNAVIFFALVSLLTYQFSKNMAVILLVAIITTNFLMANKNMREGLENQTNTPPALSKIEDKDKEIADAIPAVQNSQNNEQVASQISSKANTIASNTPITTQDNVPENVIDSNNSDLNKSKEQGPTGAGQSIGNKKTTSEHFGPRLDYAATIEQSYQNLDQLLGGDSINKLTSDTKNLMAQQQKLFDTMQNMVPVLQGAQNLLKDFNIGGLTDSLKNIGGLAGAPIPKTNK